LTRVILGPGCEQLIFCNRLKWETRHAAWKCIVQKREEAGFILIEACSKMPNVRGCNERMPPVG